MQLSGCLYKRAPTSGLYKKVDAVVEGTILCCTDYKGGPSFVLRVSNIEELVVNRAQLKFALVTKKNGAEKGRAYDFRVSTCARARGRLLWLHAPHLACYPSPSVAARPSPRLPSHRRHRV